MTRDRLGPHRYIGRDPRRGNSSVENMSGMLILHRRIGCPSAIAPACDDDRNLAGEIHETFKDAYLGAHMPPRLFRLGLGVERHLALAVIAHPYALQYCGVAEIAHRPGQRRDVRNLSIGG